MPGPGMVTFGDTSAMTTQESRAKIFMGCHELSEMGSQESAGSAASRASGDARLFAKWQAVKVSIV